MSQPTNRLPSLLNPSEQLTVSCDRPKDLLERLQNESLVITQKCLHCMERFDIEVFRGYKLCPGCRRRQGGAK